MLTCLQIMLSSEGGLTLPYPKAATNKPASVSLIVLLSSFLRCAEYELEFGSRVRSPGCISSYPLTVPEVSP